MDLDSFDHHYYRRDYVQGKKAAGLGGQLPVLPVPGEQDVYTKCQICDGVS